MDIVLDASTIMAIILNEPNKDKIIKFTKNAMLVSPDVLSYEVGNGLINLYRRQKITKEDLLESYKSYTSIPIRSIKVNIEEALLIACKYKIYAYDAYYLEIAHRLKLPLLTLDNSMEETGLDLKITIVGKSRGKKNENL